MSTRAEEVAAGLRFLVIRCARTCAGRAVHATGNLRGHFSGHLLTMFAQAYAGTGAALHRDKVNQVVAELARCQQAMAGRFSHPGFLAAYPETQFVQLEPFFHDPSPSYMEYYERGLVNHILGSRRDADSTSSPNVTYFLPFSGDHLL